MDEVSEGNIKSHEEEHSSPFYKIEYIKLFSVKLKGRLFQTIAPSIEVKEDGKSQS